MKKIVEWLYKLKADKYLHFIGGMVVAQIAFALLSLVFPLWWCAFLSFLFASIVGGVKEAFDVKHGVPKLDDFVFTMVGGLVGAALAVPIAL